MSDENKIFITVEITSSNPIPQQIIDIAQRQLELAFGEHAVIKRTEIHWARVPAPPFPTTWIKHK